MATTIRLTRMGRKKRPFYRLVVLDSRKRRDGAYLANLGYYNPFCDPAEVELHEGDILDWMTKGATLSETARSLLRQEGILHKFSLIKDGVDGADLEAKMAEWHKNSEAKAANRVAAAEAKAAAKAKAEAEAEAAAKAEEEAAAKAKAEEEAAAKAAEEAAAAAEAAEEAAEAAPAEAAEDAPAEAAEEKKDDSEDGEK